MAQRMEHPELGQILRTDVYIYEKTRGRALPDGLFWFTRHFDAAHLKNNTMEDYDVLVALSAASLTRQRMAAALCDLRRNLHDEYIRDERDRRLRMRHCLSRWLLWWPSG